MKGLGHVPFLLPKEAQVEARKEQTGRAGLSEKFKQADKSFPSETDPSNSPPHSYRVSQLPPPHRTCSASRAHIQMHFRVGSQGGDVNCRMGCSCQPESAPGPGLVQGIWKKTEKCLKPSHQSGVQRCWKAERVLWGWMGQANPDILGPKNSPTSLKGMLGLERRYNRQDTGLHVANYG